jgi:hypothetical protein
MSRNRTSPAFAGGKGIRNSNRFVKCSAVRQDLSTVRVFGTATWGQSARSEYLLLGWRASASNLYYAEGLCHGLFRASKELSV